MARTGRAVARTVRKGKKLEEKGYNKLLRASASQRRAQTQGTDAVAPPRRAARLTERAEARIERGRDMQSNPTKYTRKRRTSKK